MNNTLIWGSFHTKDICISNKVWYERKNTEPCFAARSNWTGHNSLDQSHILYDYQLQPYIWYNFQREWLIFFIHTYQRDSNDSSYSIQNKVLRCTILHTVYREIFAPFLFLPLLPSLSAGEFKTGQLPKSYIFSL